VRAPRGTRDAGERHRKKGYPHLAPTLEAPREVVDRRSQHDPVRWVCHVLQDARRRYDDQSRSRDEARLKAAIERRAAAWPPYGDRRITALRHREQGPGNRKHVARLMRARGVQRQRPARRPRTTDSAPPYPRDPNLVQGLTIVRPDQVWVGEITYVRLPREFVY
jgi:putative transposase